MFNPLSSPFEALYQEVASRVEKTPFEERNALPFGIKSLLNKKIIVLKLDRISLEDKKVTEIIKTWVFHEPGFFYEDWKIQLISKENQQPASILKEQRHIVYDLLNGKEVPLESESYSVRLSQGSLNAQRN